MDSIDSHLKHFRPICEAVEEVRDVSTGLSASDADSYLKCLLSFEFLASAVVSRHKFWTIDSGIKAHSMAQTLMKALEAEREEDKFTCCLAAETANLEPVKRELWVHSITIVNVETYYTSTASLTTISRRIGRCTAWNLLSCCLPK